MYEHDTKEFNENLVKQFLLNGTVVAPTESLLIQTDLIKKLTEKIQSNKTFCFKTDPGKFGWCATCKVGWECCQCIMNISCPLIEQQAIVKSVLIQL